MNNLETTLSSSPASCPAILLSLSSQVPALAHPHHASCSFPSLDCRWWGQKTHPCNSGLLQTPPTREAQQLHINRFSRASWSSSPRPTGTGPGCFPSAHPPGLFCIPTWGLGKSLLAGTMDKANPLVCGPLNCRASHLHSLLCEEDPLQPAFPTSPRTSHPSPLMLLSLPTLSLSLLSSFSDTFFF